MQLFPRPDDEYPQNLWRFAGWHGLNHTIFIGCVLACYVLFSAWSVLSSFQIVTNSGFDLVCDWLFYVTLGVMGAIPIVLLALASRQYVRLKRDNLCPGCLSGKNSRDESCAVCGIAWAAHVQRGPRESIDAIRAYASRQTMRSPIVLVFAALFGAYVLGFILRRSTGFDLFQSLGVPREATSVVFGMYPALLWLVPFMMLRRTSVIQQRGLCPKCLFPMGRDDARCPECGRERGAPWQREGGTSVS